MTIMPKTSFFCGHLKFHKVFIVFSFYQDNLEHVKYLRIYNFLQYKVLADIIKVVDSYYYRI